MTREQLENDNAMDDLSAAWDSVEGADNSQEDDGSAESALQSIADQPEGEQPEGEQPEGEQPEGEQPEGEQPAPEGEKPEGEKPEPDDPAPASWNAEGREMWKDLPANVKKYINLREQQVANGLEKHRQNAERAKAMDRSLAPYQQLFAMSGGAKPVIEGLLQTGAALQMGTPMQKAQTVANIIERFGVDIQTLDNIIVGKAPPPEQQQQSHIEQAVNQALAPYQRFMAQYQNQQRTAQQQSERDMRMELENFASNPEHEFFNDVRHDMADIMEVMDRRGLNVDLKEAYDRACHMNPQIRNILEQRKVTQSIDKKSRAASSVSGKPSGPGDNTIDTDDIRSAIDLAWSQAGRL